MQGGLKVYSGAPAAARQYVEADRRRADDYYLAEGTGVARRFTAGPERPVTEVAPLSGDAYEAWVAGCNPDTGVPRGRLRSDARAVRFVEVVVNGPKSWSLAAALNPDIAAAYDAAQDRAATQILDWLAQHATTRVGPAGGQVQVPVEALEAVTVAHYTSRAGDPHRHLHLQINARVFAAGKWRGLHTVGVRDSLAAINGIGHAAMACDPQFRAVLAAHGYRMDVTGEILELADYVGAMSARNQQIARNVHRYEREWTAGHPGETPGPALRRSWDARAWAQDRPDKVTPRPGVDLTERWRSQLHDLGYRDPDSPVDLTAAPIAGLDRDAVVERALTRLAAARSAWNPADLRGEVERLIAADRIVADPGVRAELAEDLAARAFHRCVAVLQRDEVPVTVPEHIRALTSPVVLEVEADLTTRLAARAGVGAPDADLTSPVQAAPVAQPLDAGQAAAVAALAGDRALVVLEGAAGAGKTATLAATRALVERSCHRLVVATPTLKAAKVARAEVGAAASSAAWLVHQHGWRWSGDGAWTRLAPGQTDPVTGRVYDGPSANAQLWPGDLLVVDEAGMLDQDTARALLTVADECRVRVALLGDRHQLAAVGRGGVLHLAAQAVDPAGHLTLAGVHRFAHTDPAGRMRPDTEYAELTLAMRSGTDPGGVFDALLARGHIRLHLDAAALQEALAATAAAHYATGEQAAVVVDTREQAANLNAAIRDQLIGAGRVDDAWVAVTAGGQRIGGGDRIATRRNDRDVGVANRDVWIVTAVGPGGELVVSPADDVPGAVTPARGPVTPGRASVTPASGAVSPAGAGERALPAGYVAAHVELAYATTAYGVQGDTVTTAHVVVEESTGAAAAYVGMTRGRQANIAHLVATDVQEAREQWIAVFARDGADLGPAHAAQQAAAEASRYAPPHPPSPTRPLEEVLAELRAAWTAEQDARFRLAIAEPVRDRLQQLVELDWKPEQRMDGLHARERRAWRGVEHADRQVRATEVLVRADADRIRQQLLDAWDGQRQDVRQASAVVLHGAGRFAQRRAAVARAGEQLTDWADAWRPYLPALPAEPRAIAEHADRSDDRPALWRAFDAAARRNAEQAHPEHAALQRAAATARTTYTQAAQARDQGRRERDEMVARFGRVTDTPDPAAGLADIDREITAARTDLAVAQARIAHLTDEPALRGQPPELLTRTRGAWEASRYADHRRQPRAIPRPPNPGSVVPHPYRHDRAAGRSGPAPGPGR